MLEITAGFLVGSIVGLTGLGGGALMTPILLLFFSKAPTTVVGTDLLFAAITKCIGVGIHGKHGTIEWTIVRRLCVGALPASVLTSLTLFLLDTPSLKSNIIKISMGIVLFFTSLIMFFKDKMTLKIDLSISAHHQKYLTILGGCFLGAMVTLTSIGAGTLGTVFLCFVYRLKPSSIVGTDLAYAIPLALVASLGHTIDFILLKNLLLGSIPGVIIGSFLSVYMKQHYLQTTLAFVLMLVSLKMIF